MTGKSGRKRVRVRPITRIVADGRLRFAPPEELVYKCRFRCRNVCKSWPPRRQDPAAIARKIRKDATLHAMFAFLTPGTKEAADPLVSPKAAAAWLRQLPALDVIGRQPHGVRALE